MASFGERLRFSDRVNGYLKRLRAPVESHYRGVVKGIGPTTRAHLTGAHRFVQSEQRLDEIFAPYFRHTENTSLLNRMLYADTKVWLPENLLAKGDR